MRGRTTGFTLLEVAIVLVVIGLLLGTILAARELLTGARVRHLIQQQDHFKLAYFAFFERYRALPGDYSAATTAIAGISTAACNGGNGNGNSLIESGPNEHTLAWEHLSKAGFLNAKYTCAASVSPTTTPTNPYGHTLEIVYDANYADAVPVNRHNLKTGGQIPSNLLAEVDLKIDDGNPLKGWFRAVPPDTGCYDPATSLWFSENPGLNCAGAAVF